MAALPSANAGPSAYFTFKWHKWLCLWTLAVYPFVAATCVILFRSKSDVRTSMFVTLLVLAVGVFASIGILGTSGVRVDDAAISRVFIGKTWQRIAWENVKSIRVFPLLGSSGKQLRGINIFPLMRSMCRLWPSGKMAFVDYPGNRVNDLIALINHYAHRRNIPIERMVDGHYEPVGFIKQRDDEAKSGFA